jgi:dTDP-4-dehydrorhamnose reductase
MGEPNNCTVIRTSIIGEEVNQGRSLIEWIKSEKNKTVFGFTNHLWNGVTCLEFAKICKKIIDNDLFWVGTKHLHSNTVNKKELVEMISEVFNLNVTVVEKQTDVACDRSLSTIYDTTNIFSIPPLYEQINELYTFSNKLYKV